MSGEYAGKGPLACWEAIDAAVGSAQLSGIVGDQAHTYGYHRGRNYVPSSDYSVQQADDQAGPGYAASALDVTLSDADMKAVSKRLNAAVNAGDPRLRCLREWYGTIDGLTVTGRDVRTGNYLTSDDSHLWHVHLSFYRRWADDETEARQVAAVCTGSSSTTTPGGDDVPDNVEVQLTSPVELAASDPQELVFAKVVTDAANLWGDNPDTSKGYLSMRIGGRKFVSTFTATVVDAPEDTTVLTSLEFLNSSGQVSRTLAWRETTGQGYIYVGDSRAGYVSTGGVARVVVQASRPCTLKAAGWSVLAW
jgi:hypothetical protein